MTITSTKILRSSIIDSVTKMSKTIVPRQSSKCNPNHNKTPGMKPKYHIYHFTLFSYLDWIELVILLLLLLLLLWYYLMMAKSRNCALQWIFPGINCFGIVKVGTDQGVLVEGWIQPEVERGQSERKESAKSTRETRALKACDNFWTFYLKHFLFLTPWWSFPQIHTWNY